jgi:hypothetical protein
MTITPFTSIRPCRWPHNTAECAVPITTVTINPTSLKMDIIQKIDLAAYAVGECPYRKEGRFGPEGSIFLCTHRRWRQGVCPDSRITSQTDDVLK